MAEGRKGIGNLESMVRFRQVCKSFGNLEVLRNVDLDVAPGERVALIGPSGSGKTTLLRLIMTLEQLSSGTIEVGGELLWHRMVNGKIVEADEKHLRHMRKKIGMVFQHFNLFHHMRVLENVTLAPIKVRGVSRTEAEQRAVQLLTMVGLSEKVNSYPAQLSGGQQQRVAIARALAMEPEVMLFDEITGALDPELVGEVLHVVRQLAHESNMTMLVVTHEMDFAREIADRVAFLDGGAIVDQGPPDKMFTDPDSPRTREFLKRVLER